ncbi:two-component system sensor histidine kinase YesM [Paenibacillus phyllosphaerae]|uniref:Two-component system sensor histidine kinase YesM n=1 Tax=Paenibacillus phyllosphaerae TaxID=274593 RepID=A0A7W5B1U9_9BACL|nr:sensor histidine kinase [Paenibacillus phyllosphaerae]MBB3112697.1 two-component system sensor histidine kinase YesM [Paenibacillus phyllosphaerae]
MPLKWLQLNNWSIRNKLIVHFLLISTLPALCIGILIAWATNGTIEKQVNNQTEQLIGNVNKSLDHYAANLQSITYFIAMNPEIQSFLTGGTAALAGDETQYRTSKFLEGFTTLYSEVAGIMVVNSDGEYLSNDMYARNDRNLTEESWYKEAVAAQGIFQLIGHPSGRNVITHANYKDSEIVSGVRAILEPESQKTEGVVLIDLKLRVIAETLRDVTLGKSGYLMVVDDKGESIYAPRNSVAGLLDVGKLNMTSGTFAEEVNGADLQFIYQQSSFTNWTTLGVFSVADTVQEIKDLNLYLVSFVFVVCMLGIAASYYLSHSISRPITQLASFMRKVEEGNMHIRIPGSRTDEVGLLGQSFNKMLAQINRLIGQVGLEQRQKREAELRSLQAHIQPHFLYNTLDTIQWLARKDGAQEATEMVQSLSKLFRIGLSKGQEMIALAEELEHIRSYLNIQQTRYKEKLHYRIEVDEEAIGRLLVLKVFLQPIVENAIYHGIKERRGPGMITIRASVTGSSIRFTVEDNGAGMSESRCAELQQMLAWNGKQPAETKPEGGEARSVESAVGSYGLRNVQERIQLSFGDGYGLTISSQLKVGTTVTIDHPIIRSKEEGQRYGA